MLKHVIDKERNNDPWARLSYEDESDEVKEAEKRTWLYTGEVD